MELDKYNMDLNKFKILIEKWLENTNAKLSGVALLSDGKQHLWSASIIVLPQQGSWKEPSVENLDYTRNLCEGGNAPNSEFLFATLQYVQFIMNPDTKAKRWQAQWTFRGPHY